MIAAKEGRTTLYVCRAQLSDGVHPGATDGTLCLIPNKGSVVEATEYEIAAGRDYSWLAGGWQDAVAAGLQHGRTALYPCRAAVTSAGGRNVVVVGKSYRTGMHAGHCYVGYQDHEVDVTTGFEVLRSSTAARSR